jgi:hypothetical protein
MHLDELNDNVLNLILLLVNVSDISRLMLTCKTLNEKVSGILKNPMIKQSFPNNLMIVHDESELNMLTSLIDISKIILRINYPICNCKIHKLINNFNPSGLHILRFVAQVNICKSFCGNIDMNWFVKLKEFCIESPFGFTRIIDNLEIINDNVNRVYLGIHAPSFLRDTLMPLTIQPKVNTFTNLQDLIFIIYFTINLYHEREVINLFKHYLPPNLKRLIIFEVPNRGSSGRQSSETSFIEDIFRIENRIRYDIKNKREHLYNSKSATLSYTNENDLKKLSNLKTLIISNPDITQDEIDKYLSNIDNLIIFNCKTERNNDNGHYVSNKLSQC